MKANQLNPDFKEFIELLNAHAVEYLVVGAYAVARYGVVRNTGDIDVWVNQSEGNVTRLVGVLAAFGVAGLGHTVADFMEPGTIVQIGVSPIRIDLLTTIDGVGFLECYPNRETSVLDGVPIAVISIQDLRRNKASTGRAKDQEDLRLLDLSNLSK
ncbi:nucleotidyltransferase [Hymenobacter sp. BT770]|uniref:nucleotidyltransferase n=1 Tax=Hymenobacter sp. BT770 TaxID=2886942 RepID=UPI001D11D6E8|nr:nucleotidyltransferase [Hymenobacter sp. BT770]MCC3152610.1 nucleotidyltransferase [Hymenobacter sp. BT770]MDO3414683.1 nucleotidyltransferase [Hymenobacter sp. BT770]